MAQGGDGDVLGMGTCSLLLDLAANGVRGRSCVLGCVQRASVYYDLVAVVVGLKREQGRGYMESRVAVGCFDINGSGGGDLVSANA